MQLNTSDLPPVTQLALAEVHLEKLEKAMKADRQDAGAIQQVTDRILQVRAWRGAEVIHDFMLEGAREWSAWYTSSRYAK